MLRKTPFFNLSYFVYVPRTVKLWYVQDSKTEKEKTMSEDAKTFTQADLDALKTEHEKAINDLKNRHKEELDRKVDGAVKKAQAEAEEKAKEARYFFLTILGSAKSYAKVTT